MSISFTIDIASCYSKSDVHEQSIQSIVSQRKTMNIHKKLKPTESETRRRKSGVIAMNSEGSTINMKCTGDTLAFAEEQLINE